MEIKKISLFTLKTATCVLLSTFALNAAGQTREELSRLTMPTEETAKVTTSGEKLQVYTFQPIAPTSSTTKDLTSGGTKAISTEPVKSTEPVTKSTETVKVIIIP